MYKIYLLWALLFAFLSCKQTDSTINKLEWSQNYIEALNSADYKKAASFFSDSVRLNELVYKSSFSKDQYHSLFQWDSVFKPTYKILDIQLKEEYVEMRVSKQCKRILFLNEEPMVTKEKVYFSDDGIYSIDIVEYIVFNETKWDKNRLELVSWTAEEYPELDGFLYDQSLKGGLKFKKAIERYQQARNTK
ncbi:hypothetical protein [Flagellimonas sp.]|uniref:hypothetical protein n=1 Tax=Flagellimonas sp. TaxID=2058762 RepID=UPI003F4A6305